MPFYSVEVVGKSISAIVNNRDKPLQFITIRIVQAQNRKQAKDIALAQVLDLDAYSQLYEHGAKGSPTLEVEDIEELSENDGISRISTGLILFDPNE